MVTESIKDRILSEADEKRISEIRFAFRNETQGAITDLLAIIDRQQKSIKEVQRNTLKRIAELVWGEAMIYPEGHRRNEIFVKAFQLLEKRLEVGE